MARAQFIADEAFELMISRAMAGTEQVARAALKAGAAIIADKMKENLKGILSDEATGQLVEAFGITPVKQDSNYNWNVHLGFDGYQQPPQKRWPQGVPFQLIARSFESGAGEWRTARPFAKPAVTATKARALDAMKSAAEKELEKIAGGR